MDSQGVMMPQSNVAPLQQRQKQTLDRGALPERQDNMPEAPSRDEISARLEAAEARTETRIAQLAGSIDTRFATIDGKLDQINGSVGALAVAVKDARDDNKEDNRLTRWTVIAIVVATMLAGVTAIWVTQGNLLSAFQAGLVAKEVTPPPPKAQQSSPQSPATQTPK